MKLIRTAALLAAASAAYNAAKDYARENPDKASTTIDKAESFVRGKAGPKYADKVGKGSQALRQSLGLPQGAPAQTSTTTSTFTTASTAAPTTPSAASGQGASAGVAADSAPSDFDPAI